MQNDEHRGHKASGLVVGSDQNVLTDSSFFNFQNELLYHHQPFQNPTSGDHLELNYKEGYTNANQGITPEAHNICVQYMQCEEDDLDNTIQGQIP